MGITLARMLSSDSARDHGSTPHRREGTGTNLAMFSSRNVWVVSCSVIAGIALVMLIGSKELATEGRFAAGELDGPLEFMPNPKYCAPELREDREGAVFVKLAAKTPSHRNYVADYCEFCSCPGVVGIDLGNTFATAGVKRRGNVEVIPDNQGIRQTPCQVTFTAEARIVGEAVSIHESEIPHQMIFDVRRLMGKTFSSALARSREKPLPYDLVEKASKPHVSVMVRGIEQTYSPEEISALVLGKVKQSAEQYLEAKVKEVVLAVPTSFTDAQRQATKDAGTIAGLNVVRIVNEPTAAAVAYGLDRGDGEKTVLVFDMGATTLAVDLMTIDEGVIEIEASAGGQLGGEDLTQRLMDSVMQSFRTKARVDTTPSLGALQRLRSAAEKAKQQLSTTLEQRIEVEDFSAGEALSELISRGQFEELCEDLFLAMLGPTQQVLRDANMSKADVDDVLIIGGSAHIPKVQELLKDFFDGKEAVTGIDPTEVVARGAAEIGSVLSGGSARSVDSDLRFLDVDDSGVVTEKVQTHCGAEDYTGTNNQVQGVDEADITKAQEQYVYILPRGEPLLVIARTYPFDEVSVVSSTPFSRFGVDPREILLDGDSLVIIGDASVERNDTGPHPAQASLSLVSVQLWNVSDRAAPVLLQTQEVEGRYQTARLMGGVAYVVIGTSFADSSHDTRCCDAKEDEERRRRVAPLARLLTHEHEDVASRLEVPLKPIASCEHVASFDGLGGPAADSWLTVLSVATQGAERALGAIQATTVTHAGRGAEVFVSNNHLYVTAPSTGRQSAEWLLVGHASTFERTLWSALVDAWSLGVARMFGLQVVSNVLSGGRQPNRWEKLAKTGEWTSVLKFELGHGKSTFQHLMSVPGTVLNQFSMHEHKGHFRIATTLNGRASSARESTSNVFVFKPDGRLAGQVTGLRLAPGERIFSARFQARLSINTCVYRSGAID